MALGYISVPLLKKNLIAAFKSNIFWDILIYLFFNDFIYTPSIYSPRLPCVVATATAVLLNCNSIECQLFLGVFFFIFAQQNFAPYTRMIAHILGTYHKNITSPLSVTCETLRLPEDKYQCIGLLAGFHFVRTCTSSADT